MVAKAMFIALVLASGAVAGDFYDRVNRQLYRSMNEPVGRARGFYEVRSREEAEALAAAGRYVMIMDGVPRPMTVKEKVAAKADEQAARDAWDARLLEASEALRDLQAIASRDRTPEQQALIYLLHVQGVRAAP